MKPLLTTTSALLSLFPLFVQETWASISTETVSKPRESRDLAGNDDLKFCARESYNANFLLTLDFDCSLTCQSKDDCPSTSGGLSFRCLETTECKEQLGNPTSRPTRRPTGFQVQVTCPSEFTSSLDLSDTLTFHYAVVSVQNNPSERVLCARLEGQSLAWLGFAISPNGGMVGSEAVIGLPDDNSVLKYNLNGKMYSLVKEMAQQRQTLLDTKIYQKDGMTVLTFAKFLKEDGELPILENGINTFLFAEGKDNDLGFHRSFGNFRVEFCEGGNCCAGSKYECLEIDGGRENGGNALAPRPTPRPSRRPVRQPSRRPSQRPSRRPSRRPSNSVSGPSRRPTRQPTENANQFQPLNQVRDACNSQFASSLSLTDTLTFHYAIGTSRTTPSERILCARLEMQRSAWVGFAISKEGEMVGSEAVIGLPDENSVLKYYLEGKSPNAIREMSQRRQTLINPEIFQEDGMTVMTFTKYLEEDGEISISTNGVNIFLIAEGRSNSLGYHPSRRAFEVEICEDAGCCASSKIECLEIASSSAASPVSRPSRRPSRQPSRRPNNMNRPTRRPTGNQSQPADDEGGNVPCLTPYQCNQQRQNMGIQNFLVSDKYNTKGCFVRGDTAYFGQGGTNADMSKATLNGAKERLWCIKSGSDTSDDSNTDSSSDDSKQSSSEGIEKRTPCLRETDCNTRRQELGFVNYKAGSNFQTKGCFSRGDAAYFGKGGTRAEKEEYPLSNGKERIFCDAST